MLTLKKKVTSQINSLTLFFNELERKSKLNTGIGAATMGFSHKIWSVLNVLYLICPNRSSLLHFALCLRRSACMDHIDGLYAL